MDYKHTTHYIKSLIKLLIASHTITNNSNKQKMGFYQLLPLKHYSSLQKLQNCLWISTMGYNTLQLQLIPASQAAVVHSLIGALKMSERHHPSLILIFHSSSSFDSLQCSLMKVCPSLTTFMSLLLPFLLICN